MTTSSKRSPELGKLYERITSYQNGFETYVFLRFTKQPWSRLGVEKGWGDPLLLWDITDSEEGPEFKTYHFLWKGNRKLHAHIHEEDGFFKWFDVWWKIKENQSD
jgi:hypothetical protein